MKTTQEYLDCLRLEHCKFDGPQWTFVSDSQDVAPIKCAIKGADEFDSFFVKTGDGEYLEIWGICGIIPYTHKNAYRIL